MQVGEQEPVGDKRPQNELEKCLLLDGCPEKAKKKNINVAEVCRWPVSNGEV